MEEESKNNYNFSPKNQGNKLLDSGDFFFNYRNDEAFNKINILETKPIKKNYNFENYFALNPSLHKTKKFIKNEYSYKTNSKNEKKYNKVKDVKYKDLKASVNSIDSMKMRELSEDEKEIENQIKHEEIMLNNLKEEKKKLIEEEKRRREMIFIEINNNKNIIEEKKEEIKEILFECQKEKRNLKINKEKNCINLGIRNESNYYKKYLEQIRKRNELINQNSNRMVEQKINKEDYNSVDETKKNKFKNAYNSYNKYKKLKINYKNENKVPLKINLNGNNYIRKKKKVKDETLNKINLNSYFQLSEKEKEKNFNYTSCDNLLNNTAFNSRKNYMNLTPNGLYRSNNTDNQKTNSNKIYKVLSSNNNNNFMTQTRFYRSRINPDELISNYAKEKVLNSNHTSRNKSYDRNTNISILPEYYDNIKINKSTSYNCLNLTEEQNRKPYEEIYFNYTNDLIHNKRLKSYKTNSFLEKGKTYNKMQKLKENKNNKLIQIDFNNNNNYLCESCLRKKILLNENLNKNI